VIDILILDTVGPINAHQVAFEHNDRALVLSEWLSVYLDLYFAIMSCYIV